jgi:hypothetical protein
VRRFEQSGFTGLEEVPRSGLPPVLSEALLQAIGKDLRHSPFEFGYTQNNCCEILGIGPELLFIYKHLIVEKTGDRRQEIITRHLPGE